jgi:DNA-directed RNA polymerase subunit F
MAEKKLTALKQMKEEIPFGGNIPAGEIPREILKTPAGIPGEILNEKRLELVDELISLHEFLNNFVDKIKLELQIGISQKNFNEFGKTIQENAKKLEGIFSEIFEENKEKGFHQILDIILKKKWQLRKIFVKGMPKDNQGIVDEKLFETLKMNQKILLEALSKENPLFEKVILNECPENLPSGVDEFVLHYEKIRLGIDRAVDGMPKLIENEPFFQSKQQVFIIFIYK